MDETQRTALVKLKRLQELYLKAKDEEAQCVKHVIQRMRDYGQTVGDASAYVGLQAATDATRMRRDELLEHVGHVNWSFSDQSLEKKP